MLGPGSWGCINGKVLRYHPAILYPWGMVGYTLTVPAACLVGLGYRAGYGVDRVAGWYAWGRVAWGWLGMQGPSYQGDQGTQQQPPADTRHNPLVHPGWVPGAGARSRSWLFVMGVACTRDVMGPPLRFTVGIYQHNPPAYYLHKIGSTSCRHIRYTTPRRNPLYKVVVCCWYAWAYAGLICR